MAESLGQVNHRTDNLDLTLFKNIQKNIHPLAFLNYTLFFTMTD